MGSNTINPNQLSNMTDQANENQLANPLEFDVEEMMNNFDPTNFDLNTLPDFSMNFDADSGNNILDEPVAPAGPVFDQTTIAQLWNQAPQQVVPMPQYFNPSPATLTPTQALPTPPPGMAFHPQVGWYIPVAMPPQFGGPAPFGMMPPGAAPVPMMAPISMPPVPLFNETPATTAAETGKQPEASRSSSRNKRKYGPSVYLGEQAKRRALGDDSGPRPVSRDSVDYHVQGRSTRSSPRTSDKQVPVTAAKKQTLVVKVSGNIKDIKTATVQQCRCPSALAAKANHVQRPRNAFMIFRTDFSAQWRTTKGEKRGTQNRDISKAAGEAWRGATPSVKASYKKRADAESKEHKIRHPYYKFNPMDLSKAKFGDSSCTCGAYRVNSAELQRLREGGRTPPNNINIGGSDNEDEEYIRPRTRSQSRADIFQAPAAQMGQQFTFGDQSPDHGFNFDAENQGNGEDLSAIQNFLNETEENNQRAPKRRSARNGSKAVHYADESEDEDENEDIEVTSTASHKNRPAPISTSRKSSNTSQLSPFKDSDWYVGSAKNDVVASRTRSKSMSMSEGDDTLFIPTGASSPSSLFDESDDNITVAPATKASPKGNKLALPSSGGRSTRSQSNGKKRQRS